MNVWFGTTTLDWPKYREHYFAINSYVKELGCVILFDWIQDADRFYKTPQKNRNISEIYENCVKAINASDAVIIEYTVPNFSSSHQINYSLLRRKPTLVMRLKKDNPRFSDSYLEALTSPFLTIREYTEKNYKTILNEFIGISRLEQGQQRYNIVLDKKQKYYLDWASSLYKRSRSEIVRSLINEEIEKDKNYKKYLTADEHTL